MKYENIKKAHISRAEIAKAFGFKNRHSFNSTSANKRYMKGVDSILRLVELKELALVFNNNADVIRKAYGIPKKLMNKNIKPIYGESPLIETLKNNKL